MDSTSEDEARGLNERLNRFEQWVVSKDVRVRAAVSEVTEDRVAEFHLRLHGSGRDWRLECCWTDPRDSGTGGNWRRLMESSIDARIQSVRLLPQLLIAMRLASETLVHRIRNANAVFDQFAASVGMPDVKSET